MIRPPTDRDEDKAAAVEVGDVVPEEQVEAAGELVHATYETADPPTPAELPKAIEAALESGRGDWPTGLCRRMWDALSDVSDHRAKSPSHLSRWYNLVGFCLRPGFGDPLDRYRVEALWKLVTSAASATGPVKGPTIPEGGADYWIMWRRLAGGLNTALQQTLCGRNSDRHCCRPRRKAWPNPGRTNWPRCGGPPPPWNAWTCRPSAPSAKPLLGQLGPKPPPYLFWSLTRLGARQQLYGPLNTVVHPSVAENWIGKLLGYAPATDHDRLGWGFCLAQLARRTGLRGVDVKDEVRDRVSAALRAADVPDGWPKMVDEVLTDADDDQTRLFGEGLPIGLRLAN